MAKVTVAELKEEARATTGEFDWDNFADETAVDTWLSQIISRASTRTQAAVGATNYASADSLISGTLREAEFAIGMALFLRRRIMVLSSRPEEAPPPEYIDLPVVERLLERYEDDFRDLTSRYVTSSEGRPSLAFAFVSTGVDETLADEYPDTDYGSLE